MQDYNILVTFHPNERGKAEAEVADRIKEGGLTLEELGESSVGGLMLVRVSGEPRAAVKQLRTFFKQFPEAFRFTHHWIPIEKWVPSTEERMIQTAMEFGSRIGGDERWRMDLQKRHYGTGSTLELVIRLTDGINKGKVDLENPEKIIIVEIIGETAGFALVSEDETLDVNKLREELGLVKIF